MLKGQTTVTKENLLQWIENYRWMVKTIEEARQPVAKGCFFLIYKFGIITIKYINII